MSSGVGLMVCEHIHFDPSNCAMVVIYKEKPSQALLAKLKELGKLTKAECLADKSQ